MIDFLTQLSAITADHPFLTLATIAIFSIAFDHTYKRGHADGYRKGIGDRIAIMAEAIAMASEGDDDGDE